MRKFGKLKGYQGDIKGKALIDYISWLMPMMEEKIEGWSGNFWSHDAGMITQYLSDDVKKRVDDAEKAFDPFWQAYLKLKHALVSDLKLTDRENSLFWLIMEYKEIDDEGNYTWDKYVANFKKYHEILKELTDEDNEFIKFWVGGY